MSNNVPAQADHPAALLYVRDGVLVSKRFDGNSLTGEPATVVDGVRHSPASFNGGVYGLG